MARHVIIIWLCLFASLAGAGERADGLPPPVSHSHVLKDFVFGTGETMPEMTVHYLTLGDPANPPILFLHGTTGSAESLLAGKMAALLFGPGKPWDAARHFIIVPDSIGAGRSSKPSDGLRAKFPRYNYGDMVSAQYRLLREGMGIERVRAVGGISMGGMLSWVWATTHPEFMDAIVPLGCLPWPMSGRNWMLRRMMIDAVRNDPAWMGGDYVEQPRHFRRVFTFYIIANNLGVLNLMRRAPTREKADELLDRLLAAPTGGDANDFLYQWDASRDYDPYPRLDRVKARVFAVNAEDDELWPARAGVMDVVKDLLKNVEYVEIPASFTSKGHGTVADVELWGDRLGVFMNNLPR